MRFGTEVALDRVALRVFPGEVHCLMGENGAGKSTLIKAVSGALSLSDGVMRLAGRTVQFSSPHDAQQAGISSVFQEIDLLPNLSVAENIWLGREPRRFGLVDWHQMRTQATAILEDFGLQIDVTSRLDSHSLAVQQMVAIARAISTEVRVLVLDEPTSSLDADECAELFRVVRQLKQRGVAIIFISHFLDQVYEISDRITVLRDGQLVGEYVTSELLRIDLVQAMLGRSGDDLRERPRLYAVPEQDDSPYLRARGLTVNTRLQDVSVDIKEGEVLGLAGLLGSGRTELARALTGLDPLGAGAVWVDGTRKRLRGPRAAITAGIVYSSENRRTEGIISELSVRDNITLALQAQRGVWRRIGAARQRELAVSWIEALGIRPADIERPAGTLSGGNQQKVLLARLLALSPRLLVLDEPTRGIDVGAKAQIQNLVGELADNGLAVLFVSAELEEVLRVSQRVGIMVGGRMVDIIDSDELSIDSVTALVTRPDDLDD